MEKPNSTKDTQQFEFKLLLNNNIIIQRLFSVNNFNKNAINSLDFKESVDYIQDIINNHLKEKTLVYMFDNFYEFLYDPNFDSNKNSVDKFIMEIRKDNQLLSYREWSASIYPSAIRHSVDIRGYIFHIIKDLQKTLSEPNKRLVTKYLEYKLV